MNDFIIANAGVILEACAEWFGRGPSTDLSIAHDDMRGAGEYEMEDYV